MKKRRDCGSCLHVTPQGVASRCQGCKPSHGFGTHWASYRWAARAPVEAQVMVLQERARKAQRAIELARGYSPTPKLLRTLQKRRRKASRRAVRALKRFLRSKPPRAWDEEAKRGVYIGAARWPDGVGRFIGLLTDQSLGDVPPTRGRFVMPGPNPYQLPKPFDPATSPGMTDMMVDPDTLDAFMEANPLPEEAWPGPGDKPHDYSPDYMAMGDCRICGHTEEAHRRDRK